MYGMGVLNRFGAAILSYMDDTHCFMLYACAYD